MYFTRILALAAAIVASAASLAPLHGHVGSSTTIIPGKFIVKMKKVVNESAKNEVKSLMDHVDHVYNTTSFKGFAGRLNDAALGSVRAHPGVDYVQRDAFLPASSYVTQHGAPWGLGRISHKGHGNFTDNTTYVYEGSAGEGVCAYVLDSGIFVDHEEFEGRAEFLENFTSDEDDDFDEHGTHVAGTIGGATYGVAKKVKLYSVKVMPSYQSESTQTRSNEVRSNGAILSIAVKAMAFVANDSQTRHCPNGTVVNMSFETMVFQQAVNDMAEELLNAGVFVVAAAGNDNRDTNRVSPASEPRICTVGAMDNNNHIADFSNYGPLVDIMAPGVDILSAGVANTTAWKVASGTSAAAPHVAGLGACLLASKHKDPKTLCDYMVRMASPSIIGVRNDTVNLVAFNGNPKG